MKDKSLSSHANPNLLKKSPDTKKKAEDELYEEAINRLAELFYRHALIRLKEKHKNRNKKL